MEDIIVFGKGAYYKYKKEEICKKYHVTAFLDNNACGEEVDGIRVYNPKDIGSLPKKPILIMASKKFFMSMVKQLLELNVSPSRIKMGLLEKPAFDAVENALQSTNTLIKVVDGKLNIKYLDTVYEIKDIDTFHRLAKQIIDKNNPWIDRLKELPVDPLSRSFGTERGVAIDRYYIEKFLADNKDKIVGTVIEVAEDTYTQKYGTDVKDSYILHVENWGDVGKKHMKMNLATGEGVKENFADCIVLTQTIQMIYEVDEVIKNLKKLLKPGGVVLITAHCIGQISLNDYNNWGEYWRFTDLAFEKLLKKEFKDVKVQAYGNVKALICFLYGLCLEDMSEEELDYFDAQYPMIVAASVRKEI
ncbi:Methyltransferase domain-containing protein [Lachnospiraceae bacterium A10]|nr:Methyltransferase domain-containing protein [Lachnospiraceae bacterium A10]